MVICGPSAAQTAVICVPLQHGCWYDVSSSGTVGDKSDSGCLAATRTEPEIRGLCVQVVPRKPGGREVVLA